MRRDAVLVDQFDTPWALALSLAQSVGDAADGAVVFDPTIGTGVLLEALEEVVGHEVLGMGTDLDPRRVRALRSRRPCWRVGRADSTRERSTRSSPVWRSTRQGIDLVMLNPPFSFRGGAGVQVELDGRPQTVSPSAAVMLQVLRVTTPRLGMVGILPVGFFVNKRDALVRALLEERYDIQQLPLSRRAFSGVVASTVAVRITPKNDLVVSLDGGPVESTPVEWSGCKCVVVRRGTLQLHNLPAGVERNDVVHTSDLAGADLVSARVRLGPRAVSGQLVLVPRVGKFDSRKICAVSGSFLLSDCVIALSVSSPSVGEMLSDVLRDTDTGLEDLYAGTGAPHVTVPRLASRLRQLGLAVREPFEACLCGTSLRRSA